MISIVSSVFTLMLGLLEAMHDYALKSHHLQNCALAVGELVQELKLVRSSPEAVQYEMDQADEARKGQPHQRTFGCAWKNPSGESAGRLVDQAGLKGARVGGAMISLEHGNFLVNAGNATAQDVLALLSQIEYTVEVPLEREVEIWSTEPLDSSSTSGATGSRSLESGLDHPEARGRNTEGGLG